MAAPERAWAALCLLAALSLGLASASHAQPGPQPAQQAANGAGLYEGLMLAVQADGAITGYYREEQGEGVSKRCAFFLSGQRTAGSGPVTLQTWATEVFAGSLQFEPQAVTLRIEQGRDHPGCAAVLLPQIASGLRLSLLDATRWTGLRRVVAARSWFHAAPQRARRLRTFVVAGDVVAVTAQQGDWLQVAYPGAKGLVTGWMPAADLAAPAPPH